MGKSNRIKSKKSLAKSTFHVNENVNKIIDYVDDSKKQVKDLSHGGIFSSLVSAINVYLRDWHYHSSKNPTFHYYQNLWEVINLKSCQDLLLKWNGKSFKDGITITTVENFIKHILLVQLKFLNYFDSSSKQIQDINCKELICNLYNDRKQLESILIFAYDESKVRYCSSYHYINDNNGIIISKNNEQLSINFRTSLPQPFDASRSNFFFSIQKVIAEILESLNIPDGSISLLFSILLLLPLLENPLLLSPVYNSLRAIRSSCNVVGFCNNSN